MNREEHERAIFEQAFNPPPLAVEPFNVGQPFNADELLDGVSVEERQVPVDPHSAVGRVMAEAREAWAQPGYEPLDPDTWTVEPLPVELVGE